MQIRLHIQQGKSSRQVDTHRSPGWAHFHEKDFDLLLHWVLLQSRRSGGYWMSQNSLCCTYCAVHRSVHTLPQSR